MLKKAFLLAAVVGILLSFSFVKGEEPPPPPPADTGPSDAADKALQEKIAKLIDQLGSDKFDEREAAKNALLDIGEDARDALEKATKHSDVEIAASASELLQKINKPSLKIICVDEKGNPLKNKGATISASDSAYNPMREPESWDCILQNKTDEQGSITFEAPENNGARFKIEVEGCGAVLTNRLKLQGGRTTIRLRFAPLSTLRGTVVDAEMNGLPIPHASIRIGDNSTTTDDKGHFVLTDVPSGFQQVIVGIPLHASTGQAMAIMRHVLVPERKDDKAERTLEFDVFSRHIDPADPSNSTIKCALLLPDGRPFASGTGYVSLRRTDGRAPWFVYNNEGRWNFKSDEKGLAEITLAPKEKYSVTLLIAGYAPVDLGEHEFKPGDKWEIPKPVTLDAGISVEVSVKDADGNAVSGARVFAQPLKRGIRRLPSLPYFAFAPDDEDYGAFWGTAGTGDSGDANLSGLEEGAASFRVACEGYVTSKGKTVELKKGEKAKVEFVLVSTAQCDVTAIDEETKEPIEEDFETSTIPAESGDGAEAIPLPTAQTGEVLPGKNYVCVELPGYLPAYCAAEFAPGENKQMTMNFRKIGKGALTGKIEPSKEIPLSRVAYAMIFSLRDSIRAEKPRLLRLNAIEGTFRVPALEEGAWMINVRDADDNVVATKAFRIEKDKTTNLAVPLRNTASLQITLKGIDKEAAKNIVLHLIPINNSGQLSLFFTSALSTYRCPTSFARPDENGRFKFDSIPEGGYLVSAMKDGVVTYPGWMFYVLLNPHEIKSAEWNLSGKNVVSGRIVEPVDNMYKLCLLPSENEDDTVMTALHLPSMDTLDGLFAFVADIPGTYRLIAIAATSPPKLSLCTEFEVKPGEPPPAVELRFPKKTQKFSGAVRNYKYGEYHGTDIVLLIGENVCMAEIMPDGKFLGLAPPGKYKAYLWNDSYPRASEPAGAKPVEITIEDGKDLAGVELEEK